MLTEFKDSDSAIRARLRKLGFKATAFLPDWRETLRACDFHLAKRELQTFFHYAAEQAVARQGEDGRCKYRVEFVPGWEVFAERPCYDTAVAFIEGAPDYADLIWAYFWAYLIECCPGGMLLKDVCNRRPENELSLTRSHGSKQLPLPGTTLKSHPVPQRHAFYTQMQKNGQVSLPRRVTDDAAAAMKQMELYCIAHPGSPSAVRCPQLFIRDKLWVALLGPSVEEGIVGFGPTVAAALRAFDVQYLAGLRPPSEAIKPRRSFRAHRRRLADCDFAQPLEQS